MLMKYNENLFFYSSDSAETPDTNTTYALIVS